jgi:hypothetical protein
MKVLFYFFFVLLLLIGEAIGSLERGAREGRGIVVFVFFSQIVLFLIKKVI